MRTLIAANWKMHGDMSWSNKPEDLEAILPAKARENIDVLICPPSPFIAPLVSSAERSNIFLGGQNCHANQTGAHTGEISAEMLKSAGANFVIVGHSERRAEGEDNSQVKAKAEAAQRASLTPIICVGEPLNVREAGNAEEYVKGQLVASLPSVQDNMVIAYEPIWAIGTGKVASIEDIKAMHSFIRSMIGEHAQILYGGSVKPGNAKDILSTANVNGALIGGASLEMGSLAEIANAAL